MPMPLEVVGLGKDEVRFVWDEGDEVIVSARTLRLGCICAMCRSEATGEKLLDDAAVPSDITVTHMTLVGNYGINIHFSDGHGTGIYRFRELRAGGYRGADYVGGADDPKGAGGTDDPRGAGKAS